LLDEILASGMAGLGLAPSEPKRMKLLAYLELLGRWNQRYNLTAVREPQAMVTRHLLDSLAIRPYLEGRRFIDVGSGAGLPGIPLAIAAEDYQFTLLDSNGKKTRFLEHVRTTLGLANVEVVQERVERFSPGQRYDAVLSRAFASLDAMIRSCRHLLADQGQYLAMKGQYPESELRALEAAGPEGSTATLIAVEPLAVPGLREERCLVRLATAARR
jgi:16S rRNA (guanine527-N7)-methyltransferase